MTHDEDLLNLWIRAGTLTRDEIRDTIDSLQEARNDLALWAQKAQEDEQNEQA